MAMHRTIDMTEPEVGVRKGAFCGTVRILRSTTADAVMISRKFIDTLARQALRRFSRALRGTRTTPRRIRSSYLGMMVIVAAILGTAGCGRVFGQSELNGLEPLPKESWSIDDARHLLFRAGFGGSKELIERVYRLGLDDAVDTLVFYDDLRRVEPFVVRTSGRPPEKKILDKMTPEARHKAVIDAVKDDRAQLDDLRAWWIWSMCVTHRPLEEKMTLFWHGHFTSGYRDVKSSVQMKTQNDLFRTHATGSFRDLSAAIGKDAAMLEYLDNRLNKKGRPNENYAREFLELFTLGPGHYSEKDIKEAARAFTGWTSTRDGKVTYKPEAHDDGEKVFLGRRGNFGADDIVRIVLEEDATAEFIARKLFLFFVHDDPSPEIVRDLAKLLRAKDKDGGDYRMKPVLRVLFKSREFYGDKARAAAIKSPILLGVVAVRQLKLDPVPLAPLVDLMAQQMGQTLFDPPNVKGWEGGRHWISTSTLFHRSNFAGMLTRDIGAENFRVQPEADDGGSGRAMRGGSDDDDRQPMSGAIGGEVRGREFLPATGAESSPTDDAMSGSTDAMSENDEDPRSKSSAAPMKYGSDIFRKLATRGSTFRFEFRPERLMHDRGLMKPSEIVEYFTSYCLALPLEKEKKFLLIEALNTDADGRPSPFKIGESDAGARIRGMLHLLLSMPEYQLH